MKYFYKILAIVIAIIILVATITGIVYGSVVKSKITSEIEQYGLIAVFGISFVTDFLPQYVSPHFLLSGSYVLESPNLLLLVFVILGSTLGSLVGFKLGHKIRKNVIEDIFGKKKYQKLKKKMNKYGRWYIALAAITPLPYIPMILGSLNLSFRNFVIFGIIPRISGFIVVSFLINGTL